ncbi:MAG: right-handed parallel beta-helix repeat-containing protein, partial [Myxococcales bacterium]
IKGVRISNPDGPCVVIKGAQHVRLVGVALGPCKDDVVSVAQSSDVRIEDSYLHDGGGVGVGSYEVAGLTVRGTFIARVRGGVYAHQSQQVRVDHSRFLVMNGGEARGQYVQFNHVTGADSVVRCNVGQNVLGQGNPEDNINLFDSQGTPDSPIVVEYNRILGGGPSPSGGGILLGDGGGAYQVARGNLLADPGQYGVAVAGGHHLTIADNRIFAQAQPFTNVGIYAWNQYEKVGVCTDVTITGNAVNYASKNGTPNPYWDGGNCSPLDEHDNDFKATLGPEVVEAPLPACD